MKESHLPPTLAGHGRVQDRRLFRLWRALPCIVLMAAAGSAQATVTKPIMSPLIPDNGELAASARPGGVARAQETEARGPSPDTIQVLLARLMALETTGDSAIARIANLQAELSRLREESARESRLRADELRELRRSVALLLDSASTSTASELLARLDAGLDAVRAEGSAGRGALHAEVGSVAHELGDLGSRVDDWTAAVSDSMAAAGGRFVEERGVRRSGDRRNTLQAGVAAGFLLLGIGAVWWYGRNRVGRLDGRIRRFQPALADGIEKAREEIAAGVRHESGEVFRGQLEALETLTGVLGSIQAMKEPGPPGPPEPDHDLPLAVCNVVNRIEGNLVAMGSGVRGYKQLMRCVRDVTENLRVHEYTMTDLLGRPYDGGMHVEAEFQADDRRAPGERTITRINRPEVRYRDRIVQNASVKVSVGL